MSSGSATTGARRITDATATRTAATLTRTQPPIEPIVDSTFTSVCAAVLMSAFIMAAILAMGTTRPVPAYAVVGSAIFGAVFGAFLVGALNLALTDSRRHKDDDH